MTENANHQEEERRRVLPTGISKIFALVHLGLPNLSRHSRIVDLASGFSSLVPELLLEGYDARGVDIVYGISSEEMARQVALYHERLRRRYPRGGDHYIEYRNASSDFLKSYGVNRELYIPGDLRAIPLPDRTADFTVSIQGITHLADDEELMHKSVDEAIRITEVGGRIILTPLYLNDKRGTRFKRQHEILFARLQASARLEVRYLEDISGWERLELTRLAV